MRANTEDGDCKETVVSAVIKKKKELKRILVQIHRGRKVDR